MFAFHLQAADTTSSLEEVGAQVALESSIGVIIARIIRIILSVLGIVTVCLIIYGGYLYLTAHGDTKRTALANQIFKNSAIGLVIILSSYSIASFILSKLLEATTTSSITSSQGAYTNEPLSSALGSGILETHYPARNALDIPRNTNIIVTFKVPIDPTSFIEGYSEDQPEGNGLNTKSVFIYETLKGKESALSSEEVAVIIDETGTTVVFDPLPLLGNSQTDTNYTVLLTSQIQTADGESAFTGSQADGYAWTFEVSTEVDLTPPQITSVIPKPSSSPYDRNIIIQVNFNEAIDPISSTGTYDLSNGKTFTHLEIVQGDENITGTFSISNNYKTIEFITKDACGKDPCGETIYCLPSLANIQAFVHAAQVGADVPQAILYGNGYNGVVDVAGNSLDGNGDGKAQGKADDEIQGNDDYTWSFSTSNTINLTVPKIIQISPTLFEGDVDLDKQVELMFSTQMRSSTLNSENIKLVPDHDQSLWYNISQELLSDEDQTNFWTNASISHALFWESTDEMLYYYYPVITQAVESAYQICLYPSNGPVQSEAMPCGDSTAPYCCNGKSSITPCSTKSGTTLP